MTKLSNASPLVESQIRSTLSAAQRLMADRKNGEALSVLRGLLPMPVVGDFWGGVAQQFYGLGDLESAERAARNFLASRRGNPKAKLMLAMILGDAGKMNDALPLAKAAARECARDQAAQFGLGLLFARSNQIDAALVQFRKAVALDPQYAEALGHIAHLGEGEPLAEDLDAIDRALESCDRQSGDGAAALWYAKATMLERQGDFAAAIGAYDRGAERMRAQRNVDMVALSRYIDRLKSSFDTSFFKRHEQHAYSNNLPIFIVGVPRSGTTLVETVLAAHPQVSSAGESTLLNLATLPYRSFEPVDLDTLEHAIGRGENPWASMGRDLKKAYAERVGAKRRVTEKNLGHHLLLGVISLIASTAPVIHCVRDRAATAWSCYRTRFETGNEWSYDFDSIARYQELYDDLMAHWQSVLPGAPILQVRYEELVAEPERVVPRILEHAGLEFDASCLQPQKARTSVRTASLAQVRRPIHTDAVRGWRRYEPWLVDRHEMFRIAADG